MFGNLKKLVKQTKKNKILRFHKQICLCEKNHAFDYDFCKQSNKSHFSIILNVILVGQNIIALKSCISILVFLRYKKMVTIFLRIVS